MYFTLLYMYNIQTEVLKLTDTAGRIIMNIANFYLIVLHETKINLNDHHYSMVV